MAGRGGRKLLSGVIVGGSRADLNYMPWQRNRWLDADYCMCGVVPRRQGDWAVVCVGESGLRSRQGDD